jgi:hypothetical protein
LNGIIEGLDQKLDVVVRKQQDEFYQGYQVFMKKKEEDFNKVLGQLRQKLNEKDKKDERIQELVIKLGEEQ